MAWAPLLLRSAPLHGFPLFDLVPEGIPAAGPAFPFADSRLKPHYPAKSPLAAVLSRVAPGNDEFLAEKYAFAIETVLSQWSQLLTGSGRDLAALKMWLDPAIESTPLAPVAETRVRAGYGIDVVRRRFPGTPTTGADQFLEQIRSWLADLATIETAEFQATSIEIVEQSTPAARIDIRYDLVGTRKDGRREERIGICRTEWSQTADMAWKATKWRFSEETVSAAEQPAFIDVTGRALGETDSYNKQLLLGIDHWRTVLDGASGIDVYGNNGVAAGDFDNDGFDDLYICQPAGLPNRLYRNRGDGTFEDVTEKAGVGVLDSTACALFADFRNTGVQDLLVVCGGGPLLFMNQGDGRFSLKRDAFQFKTPPQGTFTHAALADYDLDGRLDIYFCLYSYYVGLDQYHYPVPYFDARNGPPNFLLHNEGDGTFVDRTESAGLNAENDRYSFACAWGATGNKGLSDLYVANDFGRNNLYRNNGDGTFTAISSEAHTQDVGAGMSACWSDLDNDGKQDIYVSNMWSAAGQRVSEQKAFHENAPEAVRALYRRHARGNALYRNLGDGKFENSSQQAGVEMGRWAWSSDSWDFDHDGYSDIYVANGYISAPERNDLSSFFWRQVVAKSPNDDTPSPAYEQGWQALNEVIRSDGSWSGYERNVMFANNRDGTFSEVSGVVGLDCLEDGRSFVLADLDHDGRMEVVLKNRNAPQVRILRNAMRELGDSIAFRLKGKTSNRDAVGSAITVECGALRQTKYLQAGSGFLAQHSKEVFFGVAKPEGAVRATVRWPNGTSQRFDNLPPNHRIEIEEGAATPVAKPFLPASAADAKQLPPLDQSPLPSQVETWLIEPVKAPEFSLPDTTGNLRELRSLRGGFVLLSFWATTSTASIQQLRLLQQSYRTLSSSKLSILAINLDDRDSIKRPATSPRKNLSPIRFCLRPKMSPASITSFIAIFSIAGATLPFRLHCWSMPKA